MEHVHRESITLFPGVKALWELYSEIDSRIAALRSATALSCLPGCGACCQTPALNIEAMPFELFPMALHLHAAGEADRIHDITGSAGPRAVCVLYSPEAALKHEGGCTLYPFRPLICRLFGFAATLDKHGDPRLSVCRRIRLSNPAMAAVSGDLVAAGLDAPVFARCSSQVGTLAPGSASSRMPINQALREAIELTGYRLSLL